jgi:hypothetical protein
VHGRERGGSSNVVDEVSVEIAGCRPLISPHFNLTVELPLKVIVRGYS